jgi:hypothetical protein
MAHLEKSLGGLVENPRYIRVRISWNVALKLLILGYERDDILVLTFCMNISYVLDHE